MTGPEGLCNWWHGAVTRSSSTFETLILCMTFLATSMLSSSGFAAALVGPVIMGSRVSDEVCLAQPDDQGRVGMECECRSEAMSIIVMQDARR